MPRGNRLQEQLERGLADLGVAGASVAIRDGSRTEVEAAAGTDPLGDRAPAAADRRPYWSITKAFISATFCVQAARGRVNLDAPAGPLVKEAELPPEVTLRRLLNHTAGVPDYTAQAGYQRGLRDNPGDPWMSANFMAIARLPPSHASGTAFEYSNSGYFLLRMILHRLFGSVDEAISASILKPLGLSSVELLRGPGSMSRLAPGTTAFWGEPMDVRSRYLPEWVGHGVLAGTALDAARFFDRLLRGELLVESWLEQMLEARPVPGVQPGWSRPGYGLGLMIDRDNPLGEVVGHGGDGPGYGAATFRVTRKRRSVTVCVLTNQDGGHAAERLALLIADARLSS